MTAPSHSSDQGIYAHFWVVAGTAAKLVYGLAALRVVSERYGIEALGPTGQMLSIMAIQLLVANLGINRGLAQRTAQLLNPSDTRALISVFDGAIRISALASAASGLTLFALAGVFGQALLPGAGLKPLACLVVATPFMAINGAMTSIASGRQQSPIVGRSTVTSSILGIILVLQAPATAPLWVVLAILALLPLVNFVSLTLWLRNEPGIRLYFSRLVRFRPEIPAGPSSESAYLLRYAVFMVIPVIAAQGVRIAMRLMLDDRLGPTELGRWEAVNKIQEGYVQLFVSLLIFLFLPRAVASASTAHRAALTYITFGVVAGVVGLRIAFDLGEPILRFLYNEDAASADVALNLAILADTIRIPFFVSQYLLLAREQMRQFLLLELLANGTLLIAVSIGARYSLNAVFAFSLAQAVAMTALATWLILFHPHSSPRNQAFT